MADVITINLNHFEAEAEDGVDPLAQKTGWGALSSQSTNIKSHEMAISAERARTKRAGDLWLFFSLFGGIGLCLLLAAGWLWRDGNWLAAIAIGVFAMVLLNICRQMFFRKKRFVFDKRTGLYSCGAWPYDELDRGARGALSDIHALQLIPKRVGRKSDPSIHNFDSFELNLVLHDGYRINVLDHGHQDGMKESAQQLSEFLDKPLWTASLKPAGQCRKTKSASAYAPDTAAITLHLADTRDPVAEQLSWSGISGSNYGMQTHHISVSGERAQVRRSFMLLLRVFLYLLMGIVMFGAAVFFYPEHGTGLAVPLCVFGCMPFIFAYKAFSEQTLMVFDKRSGSYHRPATPSSKKTPQRGVQGELHAIYAIQVLGKEVVVSSGDRDTTTQSSYELNLVFADGKRANVMNHGSRSGMEKSAKLLGDFLGKPVWIGVYS